jgi:catechol 2,3-dioxygenase-like lactoylglutathione lyase family enzyme
MYRSPEDETQPAMVLPSWRLAYCQRLPNAKRLNMITIDHIGVFARDVHASARFLAQILGLPPGLPAGQDGENVCLAVGASGSIVYLPAQDVSGQHIAFRVDERAFADVVDRLHAAGVAFGNDPEDQTNGETSDFLGGHGRIFFRDPDGHLFEVMA